MPNADILLAVATADGHTAGFKDARDGTSHANPHPSAIGVCSQESDVWQAWQDGYKTGYVDGVEILRDHLRNLLARIHRDGGHYTAAHGIDKAVKDADLLVTNLVYKNERMRNVLLEIRHTLDKTAADRIPADLLH